MIPYHDPMPEGDPRVVSWFLMDNAWPTITITLCYLAFVKLIGPAWMKHKKPYNLRGIMLVYNATMVLVSSWIFYELGRYAWFGKYSWRCQPLDFSDDEESLKVAEICWYFYMSKFAEFLDTIFFVLRKKHLQVSALHVIHHALVPLTTWYGVKQGTSGLNSIFPFLNTFVHIWMYLYYALAALGPNVQKYLWWKKYLTALQIVQFITVFVIMVQMVISPSCRIPLKLFILNAGQAVFFFGLFLNFYINSYKSKKSKSSVEVNGHSKNHSD